MVFITKTWIFIKKYSSRAQDFTDKSLGIYSANHKTPHRQMRDPLQSSVAAPLPWASGLPVAIQCAWNLDPSVHWNATGEIILVASVLPVVFQRSSSGFPMVFQCVPIMQINTGSPLGHHWVLASASVVPVASQCTWGSSGLPVWSVQWYHSVLTESGLEGIRSLGQVTSQHATPYVYNWYGESCLS